MKDDMTAFIEGLGMRRFFGYVECEEVPSVLWDTGPNPDGWKDFVELAKSTNAAFLTMHSWVLDRCNPGAADHPLTRIVFRSFGSPDGFAFSALG